MSLIPIILRTTYGAALLLQSLDLVAGSSHALVSFFAICIFIFPLFFLELSNLLKVHAHVVRWASTSIDIARQLAADWRDLLEVLNHLLVEQFYLGQRVLVLDIAHGQVDLVVRTKIVAVRILWHFIFDINVGRN